MMAGAGAGRAGAGGGDAPPGGPGPRGPVAVRAGTRGSDAPPGAPGPRTPDAVRPGRISPRPSGRPPSARAHRLQADRHPGVGGVDLDRVAEPDVVDRRRVAVAVDRDL